MFKIINVHSWVLLELSSLMRYLNNSSDHTINFNQINFASYTALFNLHLGFR